MQYDFDTVIDRRQNYSAKFDELDLNFGSSDLLPLWIADMDFKTAQPIIDAIKERADQGIFGYTSRPARYYQAVQDWEKRRKHWCPSTELMSFSPGVIPGIKMVIELFTDPGDKILIQTPVYHPFFNVVTNSERTLVCSSLIEDAPGHYVMDYEDFEAKAKDGVKYFILCNPHNPVGRCWQPDELRRIGEICMRYGVTVISDEIHSDLMLFGHVHTPFASLSEEFGAHTITCIAVSKTFNLAGLQSSTLIFPNAEMKGIYDQNLKKMDIARNNCFSTVATIAACEKGEEWLGQLITYLEGNMRFVKDYCEQNLPGIKPNLPEATYLIWLDCRALGLTTEELHSLMVDKAKIALNEGQGFGVEGTGFLRLNAACPRATLQTALEKLKAALTQ